MTRGHLAVAALYGSLAAVATIAGSVVVTRGIVAILLAPGRRQWARTSPREAPAC